jgi:hypothetical protein
MTFLKMVELFQARSYWFTKKHENNRFFVMPGVVVGHPFGLNVDSRLQTAGMTDF